MENKTVFMVQLNYSTENYDGIETKLFSTYDKAYDYFIKKIEDEQDPDTSWVGSEVFNEDGDTNEDFNLDCMTSNEDKTNLWWNVTDINNYTRHTFIDLIIIEVE